MGFRITCNWWLLWYSEQMLCLVASRNEANAMARMTSLNNVKQTELLQEAVMASMDDMIRPLGYKEAGEVGNKRTYL